MLLNREELKTELRLQQTNYLQNFVISLNIMLLVAILWLYYYEFFFIANINLIGAIVFTYSYFVTTRYRVPFTIHVNLGLLVSYIFCLVFPNSSRSFNDKFV
jgi:hypothetical protein